MDRLCNQLPRQLFHAESVFGSRQQDRPKEEVEGQPEVLQQEGGTSTKRLEPAAYDRTSLRALIRKGNGLFSEGPSPAPCSCTLSPTHVELPP